MSHPEYCAYPPKLTRGVEIAAEVDGGKTIFVIGSPEVGRYLKIGLVEHRVIELLDGTADATAICSKVRQRYSLALHGASLTRFLSKLDDTGILEGKRRQSRQANMIENGFYWKWALINPDPVFTRVMPAIRWIWTAHFLAGSLVLLVASAAIALTNWAEIANYGGQLLRSHYVAVFIVTWIVGVTHEFAHGLTAKAFGGRATELGALLICYCVPALYCNVSGMYLIPGRHRRLWVIAAGLYWQLLVAASGLLAWFLFAPYTWQADFAMTLVLGSVLDVVFNANPLIKLDGYYFLSQWLRMPNLIDRSREYWTQLIENIAKGTHQTEKLPLSARERRIYLLFGAFSFFYRVALVSVIVWYTAQYLIDMFALYGVLLSVLLVLAVARTLKRWIAAALCAVKRIQGDCSEDKKVMNDEAPKESSRGRNWRGMLPVSIAIMAVLTLCIPWPASVGSYGTLLLRPESEATVRAPENGSLVLMDIRPGRHVERGATLARLGNLDLDEQIAQVRAELARVNADEKQLSGELGVEQHEWRSAALRSKQRSREFIEVEAEERQIEARLRSDPSPRNVLISLTKDRNDPVETNDFGKESVQFPAAVAALESQADLRHAKLLEAKNKLQRSRRLFGEGILPRSDLETATADVSTLEADWAEARQQLQTALVNHNRRLGSARTDLDLSKSAIDAAQAQSASLSAQLEATHRVTRSLQERLAVLEHKRQQFVLLAPLSGTILGEELPRMSGKYLLRGTEICRVADTRELMVRIQVPERQIGDVRLGQSVRVKPRALPDRVFLGVVSRIGSESEFDENRQAIYRVELSVRNDEGLLRPGMTAFARIDFGKYLTGWILAHKVKQALRPEMWML